MNRALRGSKLAHISIIIFLGVFSTIPLIFCRNYYADDIAAHLPFVKHFAEQLWSGDLYPRWLHGANAGLGSPAFFFYPPVPYYFTSLFQPFLAWSDNSGWSQLCLSSSLALTFSGLTCYTWLEKISNQRSAVVGAIVYMMWPYHLAFDLYHRLAFAEFWAFVWLPLILYYTILISRKYTVQNLLGLSLSFALLVMTHLLTFIIFFPFWLVYVFIKLNLQKLVRFLYVTLIPTILAIGLSAIYWYPAVKTQYNISPDAWWDLFSSKNLLFQNFPSPEFAIRYYEVMAVLGVVISILLFRASLKRLKGDWNREMFYWLGTSLVSVFMMSALSEPVWRALSVLQKVQYSFRFHTVLNVSVTALVALAFFSVELPSIQFKKFFRVVTFSALISGTSVVLYLSIQYNVLAIGSVAFIVLLVLAQRTNIFSGSKNPYFLVACTLIFALTLSSLLMVGRYILVRRNVGEHEVVAQSIAAGKSPPEYRPRWVSKQIFDLGAPWKTENLINMSTQIQSTPVAQGVGQVKTTTLLPRKIYLDVDASTKSVLNIPQFYYSGWTATIQGGQQPLKTVSSNEGILQVVVPPGRHSVVVKLEAGEEERTSQLISGLSAFIALVLAIIGFRSRVQKPCKLQP